MVENMRVEENENVTVFEEQENDTNVVMEEENRIVVDQDEIITEEDELLAGDEENSSIPDFFFPDPQLILEAENEAQEEFIFEKVLDNSTSPLNQRAYEKISNKSEILLGMPNSVWDQIND